MANPQTTALAEVPQIVALAATSVLRTWADIEQDEWVPTYVREGARLELERRMTDQRGQ
jgi:hypothetical protein